MFRYLNYKTLKSNSKISFVKDSDTGVITKTQKQYDASTGEAMDDIVQPITIESIEREIVQVKSQLADYESKLSNLEELEKDLKAL